MPRKDYGRVGGRRGFSRKWRAKAIELIKADLKPETLATLEEYDEFGQQRFLNKFISQYRERAVKAVEELL